MKLTPKFLLAMCLWALIAMLPTSSLAQQQSLTQALPCPVEQEIRETREQNLKRGKALDEEFYAGLAQNFADQCLQANKEIAELTPKLREYDSGKRDARDGYIILQRLLNDYAVLKSTAQEAAVTALRKKEEIARKNPEYRAMQDFALSEDILAEKRNKQETSVRKIRAQEWIPPDNRTNTFAQFGDKLVLWYQYHMDFFTLSPGAKAKLLPFGEVIVERQVSGHLETKTLNELERGKKLTFKRRLQTPVYFASTSNGQFVIACTYGYERGTSYAPMSPEEEKLVRVNGGKSWTNESGEYDSFCGIIDANGTVVFKLPFIQKNPESLLTPVGMTENGVAAFAVGEKVKKSGSDGDYSAAGKFREVLVWRYPDKMKRIGLAPPSKFLAPLKQRLTAGEF